MTFLVSFAEQPHTNGANPRGAARLALWCDGSVSLARLSPMVGAASAARGGLARMPGTGWHGQSNCTVSPLSGVGNTGDPLLRRRGAGVHSAPHHETGALGGGGGGCSCTQSVKRPRWRVSVFRTSLPSKPMKAVKVLGLAVFGNTSFITRFARFTVSGKLEWYSQKGGLNGDILTLVRVRLGGRLTGIGPPGFLIKIGLGKIGICAKSMARTVAHEVFIGLPELCRTRSRQETKRAVKN